MKSTLTCVPLVKTVLVILLYTGATAVLAADDAPASADKETEKSLQQTLADITTQKQIRIDLQNRIKKSSGITKQIYEKRLDNTSLKLLQLGLEFSENVAALDDTEKNTLEYRKQAKDILLAQFGTADSAAKRIRSRLEIPKPDLSAAEQAEAYTRLFTLLDSLNQIYELFIKSMDLSRDFGVDVSKQESQFKEEMTERAVNGSVLLEMAMNDVSALRAGVSALPEDAELIAKLKVATTHVQNLASGLADVLAMMEKLELDTSAYQEQVLAATGEITTDVFEVGVVTNLLVGWGQTLWNVVIEDGPDLIFKVFLFLIIVYGFRKLAGFVQTLVEHALAKSKLHFSELLQRMLVSIARNVVVILGVLIALSQVGISLGPLLAGLGVIGFVVGFALQDSLSNFASGLMILAYRPFDVGDLIEAGGVQGKVSQMSLVNTTILTLDNQSIVVPNNKIWGDVIRNVTAQTNRRIDMTFGVSYSDDIPKTERILQDILESHDKVLDDPEPIVRLHELADSSVNFVARPWVRKDDYWDVYWDVTRSVKMRFDEEGISIPFPQRDVHLINEPGG